MFDSAGTKFKREIPEVESHNCWGILLIANIRK